MGVWTQSRRIFRVFFLQLFEVILETTTKPEETLSQSCAEKYVGFLHFTAWNLTEYYVSYERFYWFRKSMNPSCWPHDWPPCWNWDRLNQYFRFKCVRKCVFCVNGSCANASDLPQLLSSLMILPLAYTSKKRKSNLFSFIRLKRRENCFTHPPLVVNR